MTANCTVLYYSSNREPEPFASKIREDLQLKIDLFGFPLISVTQEPIDFGINVCVGIRGPSYPNLVRQLQIGLEKIETEFTIVAEADMLYPPDYFSFVPPKVDCCFRYSNVWVIRKKNEFKRKRYVEGAQIVGTKYFLSLVNKALGGLPMWTEPYVQGVGLVHPRNSWQFYGSDNPVIIFKTGYGLRSVTGTVKDEPPVQELPYWGSARSLRKRFPFDWPK